VGKKIEKREPATNRKSTRYGVVKGKVLNWISKGR
jgi:hypothetical protein